MRSQAYIKKPIDIFTGETHNLECIVIQGEILITKLL